MIITHRPYIDYLEIKFNSYHVNRSFLDSFQVNTESAMRLGLKSRYQCKYGFFIYGDNYSWLKIDSLYHHDLEFHNLVNSFFDSYYISRADVKIDVEFNPLYSSQNLFRRRKLTIIKSSDGVEQTISFGDRKRKFCRIYRKDLESPHLHLPPTTRIEFEFRHTFLTKYDILTFKDLPKLISLFKKSLSSLFFVSPDYHSYVYSKNINKIPPEHIHRFTVNSSFDVSEKTDINYDIQLRLHAISSELRKFKKHLSIPTDSLLLFLKELINNPSSKNIKIDDLESLL
jgi:hypothetical protein